MESNDTVDWSAAPGTLPRRKVLRLASAAALALGVGAVQACRAQEGSEGVGGATPSPTPPTPIATPRPLSPTPETPSPTPEKADRRAMETVQVGPDVRVSEDDFASHAEPSIAVNPQNPANLLAACIAEAAIATYASFDGGRSWQSNGALPDSSGGRDPTVAFNTLGEGFVCANTGVVSVWRTEDGGRSFAPFVALTSVEGRSGKTDHPWLAADRSSGPSARNLYAVWSVDGNTKLGFTRSLDAGRTFEQPRVIAQADGGIVASPMVAAGKDGLVGAVYGAWPSSVLESTAKGQRGEVTAPIMAVCSSDFGETFAAPIELGIGSMETMLPGDASGLGLPAVAAEWKRDAVHVAFVTRQPGKDSTTIVVSTSTDRGRSWSSPTPVVEEKAGTYYFQPQLAVDENGRLALSAFVLEDGLVRVVLFLKAPRGDRFSAPVHLSSQAFDPATGGLPGGPKHGAWWIGDYQGLAASPSGFHALWNDTRTGRLELFSAVVRNY